SLHGPCPLEPRSESARRSTNRPHWSEPRTLRLRARHEALSSRSGRLGHLCMATTVLPCRFHRGRASAESLTHHPRLQLYMPDAGGRVHATTPPAAGMTNEGIPNAPHCRDYEALLQRHEQDCPNGGNWAYT